MKTVSVLIVLFMLGVGMALTGCFGRCDCEEGDYFDIYGLNFEFQNAYDDQYGGDTASEINIPPLVVYYQLNFISGIPSHPMGGGLISGAYALSCDCPLLGSKGSKDERIKDIQVITLNDFDAAHLAGDTVNDLLDISDAPVNESLSSFLLGPKPIIRNQFFYLLLNKAPQLNENIKLKIVLQLNTGETFEAETRPLTIIKA